MFPRPTTPFLAFAGDLYTPTALDPPPASVPAPPPRADWTSYEGPDKLLSREYQAFERSPAFLAVHRQWLERLDDCERFATQRCTPAEAAEILAGLQRMRSVLQDQYGSRFAGVKMPLLYGPAKRAMDRFCQRLAQEALPLDFRRARLRELTSALHLCQAAGPAFLKAADAMEAPVEGLRGAFWDIFAHRSDDALRRIFEGEHTDARWRALMEVHGVNRLRLEYRLPGATHSDIHSLGPNLFRPDQKPRHHRILREALDPVQVAEDLADRYWQALGSQLAAEVPGRTSREDLNPAMPKIHEAVTALGVALHPVSMNSLLTLGEDMNTVHWQNRSSLLTLDMLEALEREAIVVEQPRDTLATLQDAESRRVLMRVGTGLFLISESVPGSPTASLRPVRVTDLLALAPTLLKPKPAYWDALLATTLRDDTTSPLAQIPPRWLCTPALCRSWLARIDDTHWTQWLGDHPRLSPEHWLHMAAALNRLDRNGRLQSLLQGHALSDAHWQKVQAKPLLDVAVNAITSSACEAWRQYWQHTLPRLNAGTQMALLAPAGRANLLTQMLQREMRFGVSLIADLVTLALACGEVPRSKAMALLDCPLQSVMTKGRRVLLEPLRNMMLTAIREHWISRNDLMKWLSESGAGCGCDGAMACPTDEPLKWYLSLIDQLQSERLLDAAQVRRLVADLKEDGSAVSHEAVFHGHAQVLTTYFGWLMDAIEAQRVPKDRLLPQLTCNWREALGLDTLLDHMDEACLKAWQAVLLSAVQRGLITTESVATLLTARDEDGQPALHRVIEDVGARPHPPSDSHPPHSAWFRTVAELRRDHALDGRQFIRLLRGGADQLFGLGPPLLYRLIVARQDQARSSSYLSNLIGLHAAQLLTAEELAYLIGAPHTRKMRPALVVLIEKGDRQGLEYLVKQLILMGGKGCLHSPALVQLLNGQVSAEPGAPGAPGAPVARGVLTPGSRTALVTAIRHRDAQALRLLLDASLAMASQRSVTTSDWLTLLFPDHKDADPVRALLRVHHPPSLDVFRGCLAAARRQGLLTEPQWQQLHSRLPPASHGSHASHAVHDTLQGTSHDSSLDTSNDAPPDAITHARPLPH
ncbi:hypothetical protein [Roseateles depolymerans]|uniref:Uncharacterized protein n=1 Tax=Roseateles depolymerans TaxID=76731 RepID=A0A0U3NBA1_9BURK|nr:hypothetical protein [Roseateles depolymerans]ALV05808.1 hypothetical protein RD2015_1317 [Roseateles depolymerans]REG12920.1 hypothetical protein DES44_4292 [Roseateles depolymerans]